MKQLHPPRSLARIFAAAALLASAATLYGHDFWLVPDAFRITPGGSLEVRGQTSSRFPTSEAAVALDRVAEARLLSADGDERIRDLSHSGTSLVLRHRPAAAGQRLVAVTLRPRSVRESAEGFREYLRLEGAPEALERYEREGRLAGRDSVTRRYAKYAKTVVEVGGGARAFARTAGHPLEFVPLSDPAALRAGEHAAFRLLYRGRPLAGARLHAGAAPPTTQAAAADQHLETDAEGVVRVCVDRPGLWNVRTIHVVPADSGSGADWDTHWATLVFEVPRRATEMAVACGAPAARTG